MELAIRLELPTLRKNRIIRGEFSEGTDAHEQRIARQFRWRLCFAQLVVPRNGVNATVRGWSI